MTALIESHEAPVGKMTRHALPEPGVGAQAVQQKNRRLERAVLQVRLPLQKVEPDATALEPAVPRLPHEA